MSMVKAAFAAALVLAPSALSAQAPQPAAAQQAAAFNIDEARAAVEKLATDLEQSFVFPDVGKKYAAALRAKLAAGGYSNFPSADAFAEAVTVDLQAIHPDRHLRVRMLGAPDPSGAGRAGPREDFQGIEKAGWIADGVAYVRFLAFPGNEATLARLRRFIDEHRDARTLIIDARAHRGGGLAEMDLMFPQFYDKLQALVHMDTRLAVEERDGSPFEDGPTLVKLSGPEGVVRRSHQVIPTEQATALRDARILLLTSNRTASAAEHLSLSLKRTKRATLIGEPTRGAGHYGGTVELGHGYAAFIPVGRTFDPDTGEGWEGVGVLPDIAVPAEQALVEALAQSGIDRAEAVRLSAAYEAKAP